MRKAARDINVGDALLGEAEAGFVEGVWFPAPGRVLLVLEGGEELNLPAGLVMDVRPPPRPQIWPETARGQNPA